MHLMLIKQESKLLLTEQLQNMKDGGTFCNGFSANPFRCPPGPYERISLVAHYLKLINQILKL